MVDVMDFDLGLFGESMDLLAPTTTLLEPVEFFETPEAVAPTFETKQPDLSSEEITAADQLLDELLDYLGPEQETPEVVAVGPTEVMEQDKVFETLQPVLDLSPEEMAAPYQLLEELLKQHSSTEVPEPKEVEFSNVTTVLTEGGKTVYILTLDSKLETVEAPSRRRTKKVRTSPYDKKERKRQQDREAARRYRKSKKEQQKEREEGEQSLVTKRNELKSQVVELEAEVKTLKKLMVDLGFLPSSFKFYGGGVLKKKKK